MITDGRLRKLTEYYGKWSGNKHDLYTVIFFCVGVSCDSCSKSNFRGKRYKCLICFDYDLCSTCRDNGTTTTRHTSNHPMQCIITRSDFGKFKNFGYLYLYLFLTRQLKVYVIK